MYMQSIRRKLDARLLITLCLLAVALFLQACDDDNRGEEGRSGGMVVTTETPAEAGATAVQAEAATPTVTPAEPTPTPEPTPVPLAVGQAVTGTAQVRLYAEASSSAPVLEVYEPGASFVIMESDSDGEPYPAQVAGNAWYRVRAADGLAGWARADSFGEE